MKKYTKQELNELWTNVLNNYYNPKSHWYKDKDYLEHYKYFIEDQKNRIKINL